eukprot:gnl/Ergobibamus_cyprinoides/478.p1 GENE.gnl/Ergobibamus_cyprinoides/478~~gnl/Ergobibamus_cyprinoides/478.p1  ORF type:complete len:468 (-),score=206.09 gnl/Ergobibamus_cyprinoides/478:110-1513(-)
MLSPMFRVADLEVRDVITHGITASWVQEGPQGGRTSVEVIAPGSVYPRSVEVTLGRFEAPTVEVELSVTGASAPLVTAVLSGVTAAEELKETVEGSSDVAVSMAKPSKVKVTVRVDENGIVSVYGANCVRQATVTETIVVPADIPMDGDSSPVLATESEVAADDVAMDGSTPTTSSAPSTPAAAPTTVYKIKTRQNKLSVSARCAVSRPVAEVDALCAEEARMAAADRADVELTEARNALEAYVYGTRDELESWGRLHRFCSPTEREVLGAALTAMEDWCYSEEADEATKARFDAQQASLKALAAPAEARAAEAAGRDAAWSSLVAAVTAARESLASTDAKHAHITAEERARGEEAATAAEAWMAAQKAAIDASGDHMNAPISCGDIRAKATSLSVTVAGIMSKPAPKPSKKSKKAKKEAAATADAPTEAPTEAAPESAAAEASPETPAVDADADAAAPVADDDEDM